MKPAEVISLLQQSNQNFVDSKKKEYFTPFLNKQSPIITMLTCSDSRVQPSALLPDPTNKIFVVENIGNQISNSEGSIDYGILHLNTPILLILGHSDCGAIKAYTKAYDNEPATIQRELNNLQAAFINIKEENTLFDLIKKNINYQVQLALSKYADRVEEDKLAIVGAYFDFANDFGEAYGKLHILNINGKINF